MSCYGLQRQLGWNNVNYLGQTYYEQWHLTTLLRLNVDQLSRRLKRRYTTNDDFWSRAVIWEDLGSTSLQLKILLIICFSSVSYYDIISINEIFNFSNSKVTLILIIGMSWKAKMCDKGLLWRDSDVPWYCLTFLDIPWYSFIILDIPWCSLIFSRFFDILWYSLTFLQFDWDEQPYL